MTQKNFDYKISDQEFVELYAELCNIVARSLYNIDDDDPMMHTSDEARRAAMDIVQVLQEHELL